MNDRLTVLDNGTDETLTGAHIGPHKSTDLSNGISHCVQFACLICDLLCEVTSTRMNIHLAKMYTFRVTIWLVCFAFLFSGLGNWVGRDHSYRTKAFRHSVSEIFSRGVPEVVYCIDRDARQRGASYSPTKQAWPFWIMIRSQCQGFQFEQRRNWDKLQRKCHFQYSTTTEWTYA